MTEPKPDVVQAPRPKGGRRIEELDVFRGLAASLVVIGHFYVMELGPYFTPTALKRLGLVLDGIQAVNFFFMISGFVIFMTLEKCRDVRDFAVSRFARLYPAYFVGATISYLVRGAATSDYLWNLAFLQAHVFAPSMENVYWSLIAELAFYVWIGTVFRFRLLDRIEVVAFLWCVVAIASRSIELYRGAPFPEVVKLSLLLRDAPMFMAGILFYRVWSGEARRWTRPLIFFAFLSASFASSYWGKANEVKFLLEFAAFALFVSGRLTWIVNRPLLFLGAISYSLYLTHYTVWFVAFPFLTKRLELNVWVAAAVVVGLSVAWATVLCWTVERPANRFLRARLGRRSAPPPSEPALVPSAPPVLIEK